MKSEETARDVLPAAGRDEAATQILLQRASIHFVRYHFVYHSRILKSSRCNRVSHTNERRSFRPISINSWRYFFFSFPFLISSRLLFFPSSLSELSRSLLFFPFFENWITVEVSCERGHRFEIKIQVGEGGKDVERSNETKLFSRRNCAPRGANYYTAFFR